MSNVHILFAQTTRWLRDVPVWLMVESMFNTYNIFIVGFGILRKPVARRMEKGEKKRGIK